MPEYPIYGAGEEFVTAAESGDRAQALRALRKHVAERIADGVAARDLSALSRQMRDILKELEALGADADEAPTAEDELARRRAAFVSTQSVERPASSSKG